MGCLGLLGFANHCPCQWIRAPTHKNPKNLISSKTTKICKSIGPASVFEIPSQNMKPKIQDFSARLDCKITAPASGSGCLRANLRFSPYCNCCEHVRVWHGCLQTRVHPSNPPKKRTPRNLCPVFQKSRQSTKKNPRFQKLPLGNTARLQPYSRQT